MSDLPANCAIYMTEDGSPTLQWLRPDGYGEKMHHSGGALSESLFIYHEALLLMLKQGWPCQVFSLGLGLAYNELIAIGEIYKSGMINEDWRVWSFESEVFLRHGFCAWLERPFESPPGSESSPSLPQLYTQVLNGIALKLEVSPAELKSVARMALMNGHFQVRGTFPQDSDGVHDCSCLFYDAFSKKMAPDLWDEAQLEAWLAKITAPNCVLATYASTGTMKRALRRLGFRLQQRSGFLGKRESTLAIREEIG